MTAAGAKRSGRDVSVAIAAYNGAAYLPALLDSIVAQTLPPKEIVVADDASTDDTVQTLERYARTSPVPLTIVRHERNRGVVENFLSAFRATTGSLIAYCDQDDIWLPNKLEVCAAAFDAEASFVCHASIITDENLNETGDVFYDVAHDRRVAFPGVFVRVDCWGHQMLFDRATLDVLLELYDCDAFRTTLGTFFDHGIPFAASLTGDLRMKKEALIKFRRHSAATTRAGTVHGARGIGGRIAARAARLEVSEQALASALGAIEKCRITGAKSVERSRRAYADALALVSRRLRLARTRGLAGRLAQTPEVVRHALAQHRDYQDFEFKDLAADLLTAVYGWRKAEDRLAA